VACAAEGCRGSAAPLPSADCAAKPVRACRSRSRMGRPQRRRTRACGRAGVRACGRAHAAADAGSQPCLCAAPQRAAPVRASAARVGGQMERPHGGADAAAAAAAATVAPLLQLKRAANKAEELSRYARAVELFERAIAAAELALPRDSLVIAALLNYLSIARLSAEQASPTSSPAEAARKQMELRLRLLYLLHTRSRAGTLFAPTAEEVAYLVEEEYPWLPAQMCGAFFYVIAAAKVLEMHRFSPPCSPAEAEARLQGLYGALRVALETDAHGMLERNPRTGQAWSASPASSSPSVPNLKTAMHRLVTFALSDEAGLLLRMRAACGLTAAEETALRQLAERHKLTAERAWQQLPKETEEVNADKQQAAAADAARHGLRRCALPACGAQEPHPKLFKLCGRCRGAAYCCAAHSVEDWKRHKREDGCKAAA
jgi:hypothetical protein